MSLEVPSPFQQLQWVRCPRQAELSCTSHGGCFLAEPTLFRLVSGVARETKRKPSHRGFRIPRFPPLNEPDRVPGPRVPGVDPALIMRLGRKSLGAERCVLATWRLIDRSIYQVAGCKGELSTCCMIGATIEINKARRYGKVSKRRIFEFRIYGSTCHLPFIYAGIDCSSAGMTLNLGTLGSIIWEGIPMESQLACLPQESC